MGSKKSQRDRAAKAAAVKNAAATKKADREARKAHRKAEARKRARQTQDEDAQFEASLEVLGVRVVGMVGDGNCLFRSIADQMEGNPNRHRHYRSTIISFISSRREDFEPFIEDDESFDDYVSRMSTEAEWGGHQELYAAAEALEVNFIIHQFEGPRMLLQSTAPKRTLHISYHGEMHYNSVRALSDPAVTGKPAQRIVLNTPSSNKEESSSSSAAELVRLSVPSASEEDIRRTLRDTGGDGDAAIELLIAGYNPNEDETCHANTDRESETESRVGAGGSSVLIAPSGGSKIARCDRCDKTDHATEDCPFFSKPREAPLPPKPSSRSVEPKPPRGQASNQKQQTLGLNEIKDQKMESIEKTAPTRSGQCPCGSGKKYKKCCMKADRRRSKQPTATSLDDSQMTAAAAAAGGGTILI